MYGWVHWVYLWARGSAWLERSTDNPRAGRASLIRGKTRCGLVYCEQGDPLNGIINREVLSSNLSGPITAISFSKRKRWRKENHLLSLEKNAYRSIWFLGRDYIDKYFSLLFFMVPETPSTCGMQFSLLISFRSANTALTSSTDLWFTFKIPFCFSSFQSMSQRLILLVPYSPRNLRAVLQTALTTSSLMNLELEINSKAM